MLLLLISVKSDQHEKRCGNENGRLYIDVLNMYELGTIRPLPSDDTSSPQAWSAFVSTALTKSFDWKPAEQL